MDNSVQAGTHALHKLWYTQVLGKNLPSDLIISGDYKIMHKLTQAHRLLTVEQLLAKLRPTWDSGHFRSSHHLHTLGFCSPQMCPIIAEGLHPICQRART